MPLRGGLDRAEQLDPGKGWAELRIEAGSAAGVRAVGEMGARLTPWLSAYGQGWAGARFGQPVVWGAGAGLRARW